MALSTGRGNFNGPLIYLNARSKDKDKKKVASHFEIAKKNAEDGKIEKTGETCTRVSGNLRRPYFYERDYEGVPQKHVTFYINDEVANETYSLDCTYRIATRQLFNAIISLKDPNAIEISIWDKKGNDGKEYEALSLWQGEKLVPWKYDGRKGEIPEAEKVTFKGKQMSDFTAVDTFFEAELKAWADELFGPEKPRKNQVQEQQPQDNDGGNDTQAEEVVPPAPAPAPAPAPKPATRPAAAKPSAPKPTAAKPAAQNPAPRPTATKPTQTVKPAAQENLDEDVPF